MFSRAFLRYSYVLIVAVNVLNHLSIAQYRSPIYTDIYAEQTESFAEYRIQALAKYGQPLSHSSSYSIFGNSSLDFARSEICTPGEAGVPSIRHLFASPSHVLLQSHHEESPDYKAYISTSSLANMYLKHCILRNVFRRYARETDVEQAWSFATQVDRSSLYQIALAFLRIDCSQTSLPFSSVDLLYNGADVTLSEQYLEQENITLTEIKHLLDIRCNLRPLSLGPCSIFLDSTLLTVNGRKEALWLVKRYKATSNIKEYGPESKLGPQLILETVQRPFILFSACNDDRCVPYDRYPFRYKSNIFFPWFRKEIDAQDYQDAQKLLNSELLVAWFAKNPCIKTHRKLFPFPIGPKFQWFSTKFNGENKFKIKRHLARHGIRDIAQSFVNFTGKKIDLYVNFDVTTSDNAYLRSFDRFRRQLQEKMGKFKAYKPQPKVDHSEFLSLVHRSKFTLSPVGKGSDCHRTYEALHMGSVPVVVRGTPIDPVFDRLPVFFMNANFSNWHPDILFQSHRELVSNPNILWEKIFAFYWLLKIESLAALCADNYLRVVYSRNMRRDMQQMAVGDMDTTPESERTKHSWNDFILYHMPPIEW